MKTTTKSLCNSPNFVPTKTEPASAEAFFKIYHCDYELRIVKDVRRCFSEDFPSLSRVNKLYGEGTAEQWLTYQIGQLNLFCGAQNMSKQQLAYLCSYIVGDYYYLSVTQLVYFFHQIKMGRYGSFYGKVDPQKITDALRSFIQERNDILANIENEERKKEEEEDMKRSKPMPEWFAKKHGLTKDDSLSNILINHKV